jgi:DNA-binding MurR/RpiR family transcriptional regulator
MGVVDRIVERAATLTAAERKVAEVLAGDPQAIAFGTVAQVARRARTSGPTVVRLAVKLGYGGFVDMQSDVQQELARQLGPARDRIRQRPPTDLLAQVHQAELDNVETTLASLADATFGRIAERLADRQRRVWVLAGDVTLPVGEAICQQLGQLRAGVELLGGTEVSVSRRLSAVTAGDVVLAIDIRRYERWLLGLATYAARRGAHVVAVTDSPLSPLVGLSSDALFFAARGVGPFDSLTGALAVANALVAAVAARLRSSATHRLDAMEAAWAETRMLVDGEPRPFDGTEVTLGADGRLRAPTGSDEPTA